MKQKYLLILLSLFFYSFIFVNKTKLIVKNTLNNCPKDTLNFKKNVVFYDWGWAYFGGGDKFDKCEDSFQIRYGFTNKRVGGCLNKPSKRFVWRMHNKQSERKMKRRHGTNWREKFNRELDACCRR
jgi:hypothetical protein